jgi:hypothetical protein
VKCTVFIVASPKKDWLPLGFPHESHWLPPKMQWLPLEAKACFSDRWMGWDGMGSLPPLQILTSNLSLSDSDRLKSRLIFRFWFKQAPAHVDDRQWLPVGRARARVGEAAPRGGGQFRWIENVCCFSRNAKRAASTSLSQHAMRVSQFREKICLHVLCVTN